MSTLILRFPKRKRPAEGALSLGESGYRTEIRKRPDITFG